MAKRRFTAVDMLIHQVETGTVCGLPDMLGGLVIGIKHCIQAQADPYLMAGVLAEGIAAVVAENVPAEKQAATALAVLKLLHDRLSEHDVI